MQDQSFLGCFCQADILKKIIQKHLFSIKVDKLKFKICSIYNQKSFIYGGGGSGRGGDSADNWDL